MTAGAERKIAAFDFDGTLARGDSLIPFLRQLLGAPRLARSALVHGIALAQIGVGRGNRDTTKAAFLAHALKGQSEKQLRELGKRFGDELLSERMLEPALERTHWHKERGHELVLVSASLDVYLEPLAEQLGFDHAITTRLEIANGHATGKLVGGNVRAAAKARLVAEWIAGKDAELWAYGNSSGDYELLEMSDHPFWIKKDSTINPWLGRP